MNKKNIFLPALLLFISVNLNSQSLTNNNVYLLYVLETNDTAVASQSSPYFSAKFSSPFLTSDYDKVLKVSSQRIWNHENAGDSLINFDFALGLTSFFTPDRSIASTQYLTLNDLNGDATVIGPKWPNDGLYPHIIDRFRYKNGLVYSEKLTQEKDLRFIISTDSIAEVSKKGVTTIKLRKNYLDPSKMAMSFVEKWNFDPVKGNFEKNVKMVGYLKLIVDPATGEHIGYSDAIYIDNPDGVYNSKSDILLKKNVICDESLKMWESEMSNEDVHAPSAGEAIEMLEYGSSEIPSFERVKFISSLFYYAYHNPSKVFPVKNNEVDSLHPYHTAMEITNNFSIWDSTFQAEYPPNSGNYVIAPLNTQIPIGNIYAIRFYEDWYYDPKEMTIKKKVNGIGFLYIKSDGPSWNAFPDAGIYIKVN